MFMEDEVLPDTTLDDTVSRMEAALAAAKGEAAVEEKVEEVKATPRKLQQLAVDKVEEVKDRVVSAPMRLKAATLATFAEAQAEAKVGANATAEGWGAHRHACYVVQLHHHSPVPLQLIR